MPIFNNGLRVEPALKVTQYDRAAGLLLAALILVGASVGVLLLIALITSQVKQKDYSPVATVARGFRAEHTSEATELETPALEELTELKDIPTVPSLMEVADAASSVAAFSNGFNLSALPGRNTARASVNRRPIGPPQNSPDVVPTWKRWEIRYQTNSLQGYVRQLEFFRIELGAIGGKPTIDYLRLVPGGISTVGHGSSWDEKRLYMTWRAGTLKEFDRKLLERAGIETTGRQMLQFYPQEIEDQLAQIEREHAQESGHIHPEELLRTVFGVTSVGKGFKFYVLEQHFRSVIRNP